MTKRFSEYDARYYKTVDVATGYEEWSHTYDQTVDDRLDLTLLATLTTVSWKNLHTAVELACGTAHFFYSRGFQRILIVPLGNPWRLKTSCISSATISMLVETLAFPCWKCTNDWWIGNGSRKDREWLDT